MHERVNSNTILTNHLKCVLVNSSEEIEKKKKQEEIAETSLTFEFERVAIICANKHNSK